MESNQTVILSGTVSSEITYSHTTKDKDIYTFNLDVYRASGTLDVLPVMASENIVDVNKQWVGRDVEVTGELHSYNDRSGEKSRLVLYVMAKTISELDESEMPFDDENQIYIDRGIIVKEPMYRITPSGKEICDLLIAINRPNGKSDYIPSICWGSSARYIRRLDPQSVVGRKFTARGRIQSREYIKKFSESEFEKRTAYEVSYSMIRIDKEDSNDNDQ